MRKFFSGSYLLFEILALVFLAFSAWYDGWWIEPLTPEEGRVLHEALSGRDGEHPESAVNPEAVEAFARSDDERAFYMLNLIENRERSAGEADAAGGAESVDERYTSVVFPLLFARACHPALVAQPLRTFSEPAIEEEWDALFIIRYRSRRDLLELVTTPAFQEAWGHKLATVEKTTVIPVSPIIPGTSLKLVFALLLIAIGVIGHELIRRRKRARGGGRTS